MSLRELPARTTDHADRATRKEAIAASTAGRATPLCPHPRHTRRRRDSPAGGAWRQDRGPSSPDTAASALPHPTGGRRRHERRGPGNDLHRGPDGYHLIRERQPPVADDPLRRVRVRVDRGRPRRRDRGRLPVRDGFGVRGTSVRHPLPLPAHAIRRRTNDPHPEKPTNGRLPIGTQVQLMRHATIVTGVVEHDEPQWNSTTFPVAYTWHSARIWTLAGIEECTVITAPNAAAPDNRAVRTLEYVQKILTARKGLLRYRRWPPTRDSSVSAPAARRPLCLRLTSLTERVFFGGVLQARHVGLIGSLLRVVADLVAVQGTIFGLPGHGVYGRTVRPNLERPVRAHAQHRGLTASLRCV